MLCGSKTGCFNCYVICKFGSVVKNLANRIAEIMLLGFAMSLPAISKAVPWSGEVLTKGRPRVQLMPFSNPIIFNGARPWSWYMATMISNLPLYAW